jgi:predicted phosphate transport protein (TIGR00153 family)
MKQMRNILSWLGAAEEDAVLKDAELHVEETCKTVSFLATAIRAHIEGDLSGGIAAIQQIKASERRADQLRAKMITELSGDMVLPPDREDLMRFASSLDKIADSTLRAGRILGLMEARLPEPVLRDMAISTELVVKGMGHLHEAIKALGKDQISEALTGCELVERCEHEADDQKRSMLKAVLHAGLDAPHLLLCYNLAEALEAITDRIDTVADMLKLFAVRSR